MDRERDLRRTYSTLRSLGMGVIIFGVWSLVKTMTLIVLTPLENYIGKDELTAYAAYTGYIRALLYFFVFVFLILDLIPRIYIGRNAIRIGLGIKPGKAFKPLSWFLFFLWALLDLISLFLLPQTLESSPELVFDNIASLVVDITSTVIVGELCFSIRRLNKLEQEKG